MIRKEISFTAAASAVLPGVPVRLFDVQWPKLAQRLKLTGSEACTTTTYSESKARTSSSFELLTLQTQSNISTNLARSILMMKFRLL